MSGSMYFSPSKQLYRQIFYAASRWFGPRLLVSEAPCILDHCLRYPAVAWSQGDVAASMLLYMGRVKSVRPIKS